MRDRTNNLTKNLLYFFFFLLFFKKKRIVTKWRNGAKKNTDSAACQKKFFYTMSLPSRPFRTWDKPGSCRAETVSCGLFFCADLFFEGFFTGAFFRRNLPDKIFFFFLHQGFFSQRCLVSALMFFVTSTPDDRSSFHFRSSPRCTPLDRMPIRLMKLRAEKLHRLHRRGDPGFCQMMKLP